MAAAAMGKMYCVMRKRCKGVGRARIVFELVLCSQGCRERLYSQPEKSRTSEAGQRKTAGG